MANPIGSGEKKNPPGGNTLLTTMTKDGKKVQTLLWIDSIATDLNLQIDSAQVRRGLVHRPIRMQERYLVLNTLWNVADREKYLQLIEKLRNHWVFNLNEDRPTPMKILNYGANKTWLGFIGQASVGYAVTDVILRYQLQMRVVPTLSDKISRISGKATPFVPTAQDVDYYGDGWWTINDYLAQWDWNIGERNAEPEDGPRSGNRGTARGNTAGSAPSQGTPATADQPGITRSGKPYVIRHGKPWYQDTGYAVPDSDMPI